MGLTGRKISTQGKEALSNDEDCPSTAWIPVSGSRLLIPGSIHENEEYHLPWKFGRRFIPGYEIVSYDLSDPSQL